LNSTVGTSAADFVARLRTAGPRGVAGAARRRTTEPLQGHARGWWLARHPLAVGPGDLRAALGGRGLEAALRGPVRDALPTVAAFERSLEGLDPAARADLLRRADAVAAHRFELLGSGPVELGPEIPWHRDFLHDHEWPLLHNRLLDAFVAGADVKMPWELSRCQHLPLLAAAFRLTGERAYLEEIGAQLRSWIAANPVEIGVNWMCTMDVAIRAANWVATLVVVPEAAAEPWAEQVAGCLLLHGRFIHRYPEWSEVRTNHYLSDVVGLLVVASLFAGGEEGSEWLAWGTEQLVAEIEHEVRPDGCDHEASIPYHRLVTELFLCGTQVVDSLTPGAFPGWYRERLTKMFEFVAAYTRPDGLAPLVGDNDDGRFLPLGDYARTDSRSHLHLFAQAGREIPDRTGCAGFPEGGFFVIRGGGIHLLIRCGDTGLGGQGGHAHNDQLSFNLSYGSDALIEDPGAYRYFPDPELRNLFRSTASHATLQVDGEEQNPLPTPPRFPLGDRTGAEVLEWAPEAPRPVFAGRHHGFEGAPTRAGYERRFELDPGEPALTITDTVSSPAAHRLDWAFPLGRSIRIGLEPGVATVEFEQTTMRVEAKGVEFELAEGWYSPSYGVREPRPFLRAHRAGAPGRTETVFRLRFLKPGAGEL
jgi:hypothetical protein